MIKVLVIVNGLAHEGVSGIVLSYLENIKDKDIHMILGIAGDALPDCIERVEKADIDYVFFPSRMHDTFRYCKQLMLYIKKEKVDIIHVNGNSSTIGIDLFAGMMAGCKIRIAHSHNTSTSSLLRHRLLKPLLYLTCNKRFACGELAGKWLFGNKSFTIIPNAIKTSNFQYNEKSRKKYRQELNVKDDEFLIGHVGAFNDIKNQERLVYILKEFSRLHAGKLLLVGEGPNFEHIKSIVAENDLDSSVILYGNSSHVNELMSAMDFFVLPSKYEGFPTVLVEAQASGLPCIVSDSVSNETMLTSLVQFVSLNMDDSYWAKQIYSSYVSDRVTSSSKGIIALKDKNYDIEKASDFLIRQYRG